MRIGELADQASTTAKTIRFYERTGLLPEALRTPSGYRVYDDSSLGRLRFIKAAQAAGLTLAEIAEVIAAREHTGPPCSHVTKLLDEHAADLDRRLAELTALRDEIQRLRGRATTLDPAACGHEVVCHVIPS